MFLFLFLLLLITAPSKIFSMEIPKEKPSRDLTVKVQHKAEWYSFPCYPKITVADIKTDLEKATGIEFKNQELYGIKLDDNQTKLERFVLVDNSQKIISFVSAGHTFLLERSSISNSAGRRKVIAKRTTNQN